MITNQHIKDMSYVFDYYSLQKVINIVEYKDVFWFYHPIKTSIVFSALNLLDNLAYLTPYHELQQKIP